MTTHTLTTEIEHLFDFGSPVAGERESAHPTLEVTYRYSPGYTPRTPRGEYGPIDPPEPAELEFISVKIVNDDHLGLTVEKAAEIAEEWLHDAGYEQAVDHAASQYHADPDEAYERRRDDERDGTFERSGDKRDFDL